MTFSKDPLNHPRMVAQLIQLLKENPDGLRAKELCDIFNISITTFKIILRKARHALSVDNTNISVDTVHYKYKLELSDEHERFNIDYIVTRLMTLEDEIKSKVNAFAFDTFEGQRARLVLKTIKRAIEDVTELK